MDWNDIGKSVLIVAPAVIAPVVSVATLLLKIRESNARTRAHAIATESYALAKSVGELGPGDAGSAHAPYLRNELLRSGNHAIRRYLQLSTAKPSMIRTWIEGMVFSVAFVLSGEALLEFPKALQLTEGPWTLTWYALGSFFVVVGALILVALGVAIRRRRRAISRLFRQWLRKGRPETAPVPLTQPSNLDAS